MGLRQIHDGDYPGCLMEGGITGKRLVLRLIHKMIELSGWFLESAF